VKTLTQCAEKTSKYSSENFSKPGMKTRGPDPSGCSKTQSRNRNLVNWWVGFSIIGTHIIITRDPDLINNTGPEWKAPSLHLPIL